MILFTRFDITQRIHIIHSCKRLILLHSSISISFRIHWRGDLWSFRNIPRSRTPLLQWKLEEFLFSIFYFMNARVQGEIILNPTVIGGIILDKEEQEKGRKVMQATCNGEVTRILFPDYRQDGEGIPVINESGVMIGELPQNSPIIEAILKVQKVVYLQTAMGSPTGRWSWVQVSISTPSPDSQSPSISAR